MSRSVFLSGATREDVPALAALAAACSPHPWTASQIQAQLAPGRDSGVLVLRAIGPDADPTLCASCAYRVAVDEAEVLDVCVAPGWRRRGLARFLLGFVLGRAERAGARAVFLEARAGNGGALALYRSLGFVPCGLRREYYREPVEDAVLLVRRPPPPDC